MSNPETSKQPGGDVSVCAQLLGRFSRRRAIRNAVLYAVWKDDNGTINLSVFEGHRSASISLSPDERDQMCKLLRSD